VVTFAAREIVPNPRAAELSNDALDEAPIAIVVCPDTTTAAPTATDENDDATHWTPRTVLSVPSDVELVPIIVVPPEKFVALANAPTTTVLSAFVAASNPTTTELSPRTVESAPTRVVWFDVDADAEPIMTVSAAAAETSALVPMMVFLRPADSD